MLRATSLTSCRTRSFARAVPFGLLVSLAYSLALSLAVGPAPALAEAGRTLQTAATEAQPEAATAKGTAVPVVPPGCEGAVVNDDGTVESGYSWVPSSTEGIYVQQYASSDVPSASLRSVCVCWLRTRADDTLDFEVVVYGHDAAAESPQAEPLAAVPAQISGLPDGVPGATFTEVPLGHVNLPDGPFYVGVRWNPSVDSFFFVCVDKSPRPEPPTRVFYRDNTFEEGWGASDQTGDPAFFGHRALFVRPVPGPPSLAQVPVGAATRLGLVVALLVLGVLALRR